MEGIRPQYPTPPNEWLHDSKPDWTRYFTNIVYLGKEAEPWAECTTEEKEAWEREHPQPETEKE